MKKEAKAAAPVKRRKRRAKSKKRRVVRRRRKATQAVTLSTIAADLAKTQQQLASLIGAA